MHSRNVPPTGPRYWTIISLASVFGANLGDFVSHNLHMGHVRGLGPLALVLAALLLLERRSTRPTEAYYWLAIVTLRTAATNLADLATHDLRLGYGWVIAGLAAILLALLATARRSTPDGVPVTDARYWAAMLTAGTLGTAIGDALADDVGLGVVVASVVLSVILAGLLVLRARLVSAASYWSTIVAVRSAGTTVGDFLAHTLGLAASTGVSGLVLAGLIALWPQRRPLVTRSA